MNDQQGGLSIPSAGRPGPSGPPTGRRPGRRPPRLTAGGACTLAGVLGGALVVVLGVYGGLPGRIIVGALSMGPFAVVAFGLIPYNDALTVEGKGGCASECGLWLGVVGTVGGLILGAVLAAQGVPLGWWAWPSAILGGAVLSALLGEWVHGLWSCGRRQ